MKTLQTGILEIVYFDEGPHDGRPILILHGWPDAPEGWTEVNRHLHDAGWRTITPYLRGSGATKFLSADTPRVGAAVALAQDATDLMTALGIDRFPIIGHDWGARTAYTLSALFSERITSAVALSVAYSPRGEFKTPAFDQSRRFWYQWFMCTDPGMEKVREDPVGFARIQWDTWSPGSWFSEEDFAIAAKTFKNPDWLAITFNAYRSRWMNGEAWDSRYDDLKSRLQTIEFISTPTLMIQGVSDFCDPPSESEDRDRYFTAGYERLLLPGVGHFPHREAPNTVAAAILKHLEKH
jgi:pimeloyl-ACP methyl ester carboxylesterase